MRRARGGILLWLCLLSVASTAAAQDGANVGNGKELRAYRIPADAPHIDGSLEDEIWLAAESIDDFTQQEPDNIGGAARAHRRAGGL